MERDILSWRHLPALLITIGAVYGSLQLSQSPPAPAPPPVVMNIHIVPPPPPSPPPSPRPRVAPKQAVPPPSARNTPAPAVNEPNPTMAAPLVAEAPAPQAAPPAPPAASIAQAPAAADVSAAVEAAYGERIHGAVEAQKHYPTTKDAMIEQPRGVVAVWITLNRQGAVVGSGIEQSRGGILNQAALESVRRAAYPPFPAGLYPGENQHRFIVSLSYAPQ